MTKRLALVFTVVGTAALAAPPVVQLDSSRLTPAAARLGSSNSAAVSVFLSGREAGENMNRGRALCLFRQAVSLDPDFALAHAYLGMALPGDAGSREMDLAMRLSTHLPAAVRLPIEAMSAQASGMTERALELRALAAREGSGDAHLEYLYGANLLALGRAGEAESVIEHAIALAPQMAPAYNDLGYARLFQGKSREAVEAFRDYVERSHGHPNAYDSLGEGLLQSGDLKGAIEAFNRAVAKQPRLAVSWAAIAQTRFLQGDPGAARAVLHHARQAFCRDGHPLLDIEEMAILAAAGDLDGAFAILDVMEERASARQQMEQLVTLALDRAQLLLMTGRPAQALGPIDVARARLASIERPGRTLRMRHTILLLRAFTRLDWKPETSATRKAIEALAKPIPSDALAQGTVAWARGVETSLQGDSRRAAHEMLSCLKTQWTYQVARARILDREGKTAKARAIRKLLFESPRRDPFYLLAVATRIVHR